MLTKGLEPNLPDARPITREGMHGLHPLGVVVQVVCLPRVIRSYLLALGIVEFCPELIVSTTTASFAIPLRNLPGQEDNNIYFINPINCGKLQNTALADISTNRRTQQRDELQRYKEAQFEIRGEKSCQHGLSVIIHTPEHCTHHTFSLTAFVSCYY